MMPWWGWLLVAVYVVMAVQTWRTTGYSHALKDAAMWSHPGQLDGGNLMVGLFVGFWAGLVWPFVFLVRGGLHHGVFVGGGRSFLRPARRKRREAELAAREAHIRELERDLGIGVPR